MNHNFYDVSGPNLGPNHSAQPFQQTLTATAIQAMTLAHNDMTPSEYFDGIIITYMENVENILQ
ncbi:hypothetical protein LKO31_02165 [Sphingopyxis sp. FBM22]|nr:hypothetical protein [Sphingopyxis yananensis]